MESITEECFWHIKFKVRLFLENYVQGICSQDQCHKVLPKGTQIRVPYGSCTLYIMYVIKLLPRWTGRLRNRHYALYEMFPEKVGAKHLITKESPKEIILLYDLLC